MTATETETLHPELTADLVERVANLSPAARASLSTFLERERILEADYRREVSLEIRRRIEAYDRGVIRAVDGEIVMERLREKIRVMQAGAIP